MGEQTILLILLVAAVGITLWLYIMKAKKHIEYKGDERWQLVQLKANNAANIINWILIILLSILPIFIDNQTTFTLQRITTFGLIYIGGRNLIELVMTMYYDRQL